MFAEAEAGLAESGPSDSDSPDKTQSRVGSSQQFTLDVVTAADLLALLERRELALRQPTKATYEKLTDTRDVLSRVDFDDTAADGAGTSNPPASSSRPR